MSLVCHECGEDIQPSDQIINHEGGMIYPNVVSLAWLPDGKTWAPVLLEAPVGIACCFNCLARNAGHVDFDAFPRLMAVGGAYNAEVALNRHNETLQGKWINMGGPEAAKGLELDDIWKNMRALIKTDACLYCEQGVGDKMYPFFTFKVMDRAHGEKRLSSFGSYQWSDIRTGATHFSFCFACGKDRLPRIFSQMSESLRGTGRSNLSEVAPSTLHIAPEVFDELLRAQGEVKMH